MAIINYQLTTAQVDAVTVPAAKQYLITNIMVCNTYDPTGGSPELHDATFTMHLIPDGDSLTNAVTTVIKVLSLPAGETFTFDSEKIVLGAGDMLSFTATSETPPGGGLTDLAVTVSYLEV